MELGIGIWLCRDKERNGFLVTSSNIGCMYLFLALIFLGLCRLASTIPLSENLYSIYVFLGIGIGFGGFDLVVFISDLN